ncbi:MAG: sulfurtransferase TusA family protein [Candidatus Omnitrophota bacterium]|nr:sulfurtransferase TusA family protein [Candidatus Omnitrophota bacterium]MBU1928304.1 sulfurtransferase TusA family protein [Candidatus Omnitrophota bacterium]MBU2035540.1 sulfurtransferase TusA family protein [Candidatus Omnitrophota bacterium]MBU2257490.1 sulfurtransferase TusA family protein [Candidatus Omnitrophota bacterium]
MEKKIVECRGKVCPIPVITALRVFNQLKKGDELEITVDDPLAIKSIPQELGSFESDVRVEKIEKGWKITINKKV